MPCNNQAVEYIVSQTGLDPKDIMVYVGRDLLQYVGVFDKERQLTPLTYGFELPMDAAIEAVLILKRGEV